MTVSRGVVHFIIHFFLPLLHHPLLFLILLLARGVLPVLQNLTEAVFGWHSVPFKNIRLRGGLDELLTGPGLPEGLDLSHAGAAAPGPPVLGIAVVLRDLLQR